MIDRYTLPGMGRVWSEAHKYELWCQVETLVLEARAAAGTVPAEAVARADDTEPRSAAAWVHYGMTSSGLLDTAMGTWDQLNPFRESPLAMGKRRGMNLDGAALDRAFRAENYVARLGSVFDRLSDLT